MKLSSLPIIAFSFGAVSTMLAAPVQVPKHVTVEAYRWTEGSQILVEVSETDKIVKITEEGQSAGWTCSQPPLIQRGNYFGQGNFLTVSTGNLLNLPGSYYGR